MAEVVNADKVSVVRPIDLPSGTYSPDAVVTIDSGNRNEPLKKLPLSELMPKTDGVSVLKGNCADNSITPEAGGDLPEDCHPEDWDCYEVEKEGDDIWIGNDKRVHAKAGWYHIDMGVYIRSPTGDEEDARAAILFGAYTGTVPDGNFNYTDYCAVDFDLSYEHMDTPSVGFDIHVENDGDVIHLSASAPALYTAECYLDWFSVHKITKISQGGGGGGGSAEGSDTAVFDLADYADDLHSDTLWRDMVGAMLDGKVVALKMPVGDDSMEGIGWIERSIRLKPGYTKEEYIDHILDTWDEELQVLTCDFTLSLYGGMAKVMETLHVTPNGARPDYAALLLAGYGAIVQGGRDRLFSEAIFPMNETGDYLDMSRYGEVLARLQLKGVPITFIGYNITNECMFGMATVDKIGYPAEPSDINHTAAFTMEIHGIATWEGEDVHNGDRFPCMYSVSYGFLPPEEDAEIDVHGKWEIESDNVYPLAIDSTYIPNAR